MSRELAEELSDWVYSLAMLDEMRVDIVTAVAPVVALTWAEPLRHHAGVT